MNLTNQQVAFARVQADAAEQTRAAFARRAHWQAAVWQLNLAMECYASELQQEAKAKFPIVPGRRMFGRLLEEYTAAGKPSRELEELARLETAPESWLSQLQVWSDRLLTLGAGEGSSVLAETTLTSPSDRIDVIQLHAEDQQDSAESVAPLDQARLRWFIEQAAALVERQRENNWEY